ncbi:MAG: AsmA family protein [Wenzhouxiangella sp.]|jgi:AsmA protein|nr:AsmA family protein [Wenzhouxiangella sp.]
MLRKTILTVIIATVLLFAAIVGAALFINPDDYRDELSSRASEMLGREVRLNGPIELKLFPSIALDIADVSVGNPIGFPEAPQLASIERASASVRLLPLLTGNLEIGSVRLEDAQISLVTSAADMSNLEGLFEAGSEPAPAGQPADLSGLSTGEIEFRSVVLSLIDLGTDTRTDVELESLSLAPFSTGREVALELAARVLEGDATLMSASFAGNITVSPDLTRIELSDWTLDFSGAGLQGTSSGSLALEPSASPMRMRLAPFELVLDAGGQDLSLSAESAIEATLGEVVRVNLPGARLDLNGETLRLEGEATIGESIAGRLDVSGERLDLTQLEPAGSSEPQPDTTGDTDYASLQALDLQLTMDLDTLKLTEGAELTAVTARSQLVDGMMTLDPLSARLFGGGFEGRAQIDFNQNPPAVIITPNLEGIRVAELVSMLTGQSPVDGQGNVAMDVRFNGFTPQAMLSSLNGSGNFALDEGVLRGLNIQALIDQELTTSNLGNIARAFGGETRFRSLTGGMRIENGIVELPDMNLSAAGYGATGQGRINLGANQVDYALMLDLGDELTARLPDSLRRATGGRIPLSIAGDLTQPTISVDLASIAEGAVRQELGRRLLEALGDDEPQGAPESGGERSGSEGSEGGSRRDAASSLLRSLLEPREEQQPEDSPESDPPPGFGLN